ncbi:5-formyltetrahydrofolate cyclo-ligase [Noviherbaspirillum sp. UKPF54]|uniref:5-formyltetrahydrofolate cyclo-ligase n=1 Tax=Noviherbaspirillum sp. UKPF54 TaxID=2601898 RepID=UPI0011B17AB9|nr:5-formyltetrahydrofolate cyclo-ligase [Noviherbaspirillum sp. UKPF54]QDZ29122.1 5-formyltetrahydrofolate cyclo-ligase [Noviherbaspirillum sp. UKPF54]
MPNNTLDKAALRRVLLANRQAIAAEVRQQWDAAIGARMLAWWNANPVGSLGVYWPIRNEPDLRGLYQDLARQGVRLALPVVTARDAPLRFLGWQPGDALVRDGFGAMVPQETADEVKPDALLIPCVGFNPGNFRLGYGGGFYDRTLAVMPRPLAVGIAYECCRAEFDVDTFDIALDVMITEQSPVEGEPRHA